MAMTMDDWAWEMALEDLRYSTLAEQAAREQCIFLFVEGESEEIAASMLLSGVLDLDALGVKIANYNGHGNMNAALRLLQLTLSHDRPIILTHDNDPASVASVKKAERQGLISDLVHCLAIPFEPIVEYPCGHRGGSFEESFPVEVFLKVVLREEFLPAGVLSNKDEFKRQFNPGKPWLEQLKSFAARLGFRDVFIKKPSIAEALATECDNLPPTYEAMASLIRTVRDKYPVVHPDHVELPKVPGLTA